MSNEKLVYVPRNWKVSFVDSTGNEQNDFVLRANAEYRIVCDGIPYNATIAGIRVEEGKTFIVAKVLMYDGYLNVMEKRADHRFDVDLVTEITPICTKYIKTSRSNREKKVTNGAPNTFTFAFDTEKYASQYRISIYAGEFVALALKDPTDSNKKSRSIFGHIIDVNAENDEIKFARYISNKGVRDVNEITIALSSLLGIYRYELKIADLAEELAGNEPDQQAAPAEE